MRNQITLVFIIAFLIRIGYSVLIQFLNPESIYLFDSWGYLHIAANLFDYGTYSQMTTEPFTADSTRTPFYPAYIYVFHILQLHGEWIVYLQALVGAGTAAIASQCAMIIKRNRTASFFVGLMVAFDIPSILLSNSVMTETWFTFFLTLAVFYFIKSVKYDEPKQRILTMLCIVLAAYTRPSAIYLILLFPLMLLVFNQQGLKYELMQAGKLILLGLLLVSPWIYRNQVTFEAPFFSSIAETNFLFHTASNIQAKVQNTSRREQEYNYRNNAPLKDLAFEYNPHVIPIFQKFARTEVIRVINEHPSVASQIFLKSWIGFFIKPIRSPISNQINLNNSANSKPLTLVESNDSYWTSFMKALKEGAPLETGLLLFQILTLLILYCAILLSIPIWLKVDTKVGLMFLVIILYFSITSSTTDLDARFRVPVVPLLALFSYPIWQKLFKNHQHE